VSDTYDFIGLDEAGRGAWAGPLVVAAVCLTRPIDGLNDSKLLGPKRRAELAAVIKQRADFIGLGVVSPAWLDRRGLTATTSRAMKLALKRAPANCPVVIDGPVNYLPKRRHVTTLINADALLPAVMAASILAKEHRDQLMRLHAGRWPQYGFERHVGYGTPAHRHALQRHGPCRLHRLSFRPLKTLALQS